MGKKSKVKSYFDYNLLFIVIFLLCFGLVILYSASYFESAMKFDNPNYYFMNQLQSTLLGLGAMTVVALFPYQKLNKAIFAVLAYFGSIGLIMLVLTPLGIERNGARRWLNLGISVQPSEVAKFCLIFFMAYFISHNARSLRKPSVFYMALGYVLLPAGLIAVVTSNLSSAIVIAGIGMVMLLVASPKLSYFVPLCLIGAAGVVGLILVQPYRMERVKIWLHPEQHEKGYQTMQALYAIGSGGLFGKGLGKGIQKLGYIPEAQNDMVYTVICEELGLVGGIAVIAMFVFMIWRFMIIANNANDMFGSMLVIGTMIHISLQVMMNIAVVTNAMPNTGVTLPFISYGGSSTAVLLVEIGLVLSVSRQIKLEE